MRIRRRQLHPSVADELRHLGCATCPSLRHDGRAHGTAQWIAHVRPIDGWATVQNDRCRKAGLAVAIVSCGGTGTYPLSVMQPGVTEIQAGGGIFGDIHYRTHYGIEHPYAMTMMTTVTSRPNPMRVICDAGKKAMSGDAALPQPLGLEGVKSVRLSAEHATIELAVPNTTLRVGDPLEFVVGYTDTTVHLHDTMYGVRDGRVETVWPVAARGRLQ